MRYLHKVKIEFTAINEADDAIAAHTAIRKQVQADIMLDNLKIITVHTYPKREDN